MFTISFLLSSAVVVMATTPYNSVDYSCLHEDSWMYNTDKHYNSYYKAYTGISSTSFSTSNGVTTIGVSYTNIVDYDREFTQTDIDNLNNRPKASTDFVKGKTTASAGKEYVWGTNIGYDTNQLPGSCSLGYYPPGPACPEKGTWNWMYPTTPAKETSSGCYNGNGPIGTLVNGAFLFNWGDGIGYCSAGVNKCTSYTWTNVAPVFENYDMDVCIGHAAMGLYHHHAYPSCLAEKLNEDGNAHSQVWGFASDGFPIYGPYQGKNLLAKSCWAKRDYSSTSPTGCSTGTRTCILKDEYDYTAGTTTLTSSKYGPDLDDETETQSGNNIIAEVGVYYQDYFYDSTCFAKGGEYLNENNGHDHDNLGFHYHFTIDESKNPIFPYSVGPKFYGCVLASSNSKSQCCLGLLNTQCTGKSTCSSSTFGVPSSDAQCTSTKTTAVAEDTNNSANELKTVSDSNGTNNTAVIAIVFSLIVSIVVVGIILTRAITSKSNKKNVAITLPNELSVQDTSLEERLLNNEQESIN